jgi:predicted small lipoprotein YifL
LGVICQYRYTYMFLHWVNMLPKLVLSKALFIVALLVGLAGCGNTGDLYLPEDAPITQGNITENTES